MGIKFFCDHCDRKINVKTFLGGKKGRCPHCEGKILIPLESAEEFQDEASRNPPNSHSIAESRVNESEITENSMSSHASVGESNSVTMKTSPATARQPSRTKNNRQHETTSQDQATAKVPSRSAKSDSSIQSHSSGSIGPKSSKSKVESRKKSGSRSHSSERLKSSFINLTPFEEAPKNARWYVAPTAGGQYGPADSELMQTWLEEGRVAENSLIWRDGWEDWLPALDLFFKRNVPTLPENSVKPPPSPIADVTDDTETSSQSKRNSQDSNTTSARYNRQKNRSNTIGILAICLLVFVALLLVVFLVLAIQWNAASVS